MLQISVQTKKEMLITNSLKRLVYAAFAEFHKNMLWLSVSTTVLVDDFTQIRYSVIQLVSSQH